MVLQSIDTSSTSRSNTSPICRQFYDLRIVLQSADWWTIWFADSSSICWSNIALQSVNIVLRSNIVLQLNIILRSNLVLQSNIVLQSATIVLKSANSSSICKYLFDLQTEYSSLICKYTSSIKYSSSIEYSSLIENRSLISFYSSSICRWFFDL